MAFFEAVLAGVKAIKGQVTYAHCEIVTNVPGLSCPLCGTAVRPGRAGHVCARTAPTAGRSPQGKRRRVRTVEAGS